MSGEDEECSEIWKLEPIKSTKGSIEILKGFRNQEHSDRLTTVAITFIAYEGTIKCQWISIWVKIVELGIKK